MRIDQTAAIITGGASGLGEATARHLRDMGAQVTLLDRDADRGEQVAAGAGENGRPPAVVRVHYAATACSTFALLIAERRAASLMRRSRKITAAQIIMIGSAAGRWS